MKRVALLIQYDGSCFSGWQRQKNAISVQEIIEDVLYKLSNQKVKIFASGRTDAGVHAYGQVAHVDIPLNNDFCKKNNFYLVSAINSLLKKTSIRILSIQNTTEEFNARFSALKKTYLYKFLCRSAPPAILKNQVWHIRKKVDVNAMKKASKLLLGKHDFTSFRSSGCQAKSPYKTIEKFKFDHLNDIIYMRVEAKSFLQNQVRIIAGSLINVGINFWKPEFISDVLSSKSRSLAGITAPPYGLYLEKIKYPKKLLNQTWPSSIYD